MADENAVGSIYIDIELETASMINQAKQANAALDGVGKAADTAGAKLDGVGNSKGVTRAANDASKAAKVMENLGNQIAVLEEAQQNGAKAAAVLAAQLRAGENATEAQIAEIGQLTARLYELRNAEEQAAAAEQKHAGVAGQLKTGITALAASFTLMRAVDYAKDFLDIADAMTQLQARIDRLSPSAAAGAQTFQSLAQIASQTGASLPNTVKLWETMTSTLQKTGATNTQILSLTDTLQKIGKIGGSSTQEMANALRQFGQSISSGTVRAQEFNSILEQMPELARQIAAGLGVSVGELRQQMLAGKLSAQDALNAITKQGAAVNDQFSKLPRSVEQATNSMLISFQELIKQVNDFTGASTTVVGVIDGISRALDTLSGKALTASQKIADLNSTADEYARRAKTYSFLGLQGWAAQSNGVSKLAKNVATLTGDIAAITSVQAQTANTKINIPQAPGTQKQTKAQKEAAAAAKKLANEQANVAQKLDDLRQKSELAASTTTELSKAQAILQAQQSLGKSATAEQIQQAGDYAAKIWDQNNALKQQAQIKQGQAAANKYIAEGNASVDPTTGQSTDATAQIDQQEQQRIAAIQQYENIDLQNRQLYEDAKTAIATTASNKRKQIAIDEQKAYNTSLSSLLGAASSSVGEVADAVGDAAGKSSAAYQALFAVSKAFAVAQAALNLQVALTQALADPSSVTVAQKFANYAAVLSAGGALVSAVSGIAFGGGKKNGGSVNGSTMYQVGEGGKPEIFQANNGSQYMIPGDNGTVLSNSQLSGGGSSGGYNQSVNFTINTTNGIDADTQTRIVSTIKEVSLAMMREQSTRSGGMLEPRRQR